ncbi:uncharacterized protein BX663DRAFT_14120 [Cokeromyces recurvatus]|uniref:uncharacterized protein n=1 Tax=Cokeromyces recurvatus TaxID=90255 RepID=UPI00221E4F1B|nr:uncharacterized protein BX663DRAFT_14120 [Cokeromyces recurvatus]KAI7907896.1 hypothetical protein BX663DRAFT_14120 [Cokeromyces recurvatus]
MEKKKRAYICIMKILYQNVLLKLILVIVGDVRKKNVLSMLFYCNLIQFYVTLVY